MFYCKQILSSYIFSQMSKGNLKLTEAALIKINSLNVHTKYNGLI